VRLQQLGDEQAELRPHARRASSQRPAPRLLGLIRTPIRGRTLYRFACLTISSRSLNRSTTGMMWRPELGREDDGLDELVRP
jgi:hypothetical protein